MSGEGFLALGALLLSIVLGINTVISAFRSQRTNEKKLSVEEQAHKDDREATVAQQRLEELNRLHPRLEALEKLCGELKERLETAERQITTGEQQSIEMIHHIVRLEGMVPNPPGPPTRPNWKLPILGTP